MESTPLRFDVDTEDSPTRDSFKRSIRRNKTFMKASLAHILIISIVVNIALSIAFAALLLSWRHARSFKANEAESDHNPLSNLKPLFARLLLFSVQLLGLKTHINIIVA